LPEGGGDTVDWVVAWVTDSPVTDLGFTAEATFQFAAGIVLLLSFPFVLHAMALLEIATIKAGLAPGPNGVLSPEQARTGELSAASVEGGFTAAAAPGLEHDSRVSALLTRGDGEGWFWLLSIFVGTVLLAVSWPVTAGLYGVWTVTAMQVAIGQSASLVLAVRMPAAAIVLGVMSSAVGIYATSDSTGRVWRWTSPSILSLLFLPLVAGMPPSWLYLITLRGASSALGALSLFASHAGDLSGALANVITTVSLTAGAGIIGVTGSLFISGRRQLATERELSATELAKRHELEERNRIAQELHDVVAHSMSVISVQATTA